MRRRVVAPRRRTCDGPGVLCEELADALSPLLRNRCTDMFFFDPLLGASSRMVARSPEVPEIDADVELGYDYLNSPILAEFYTVSLRCMSSAGLQEAAARKVRLLKTPAMRADEIARACDTLQKAKRGHESCVRCRGVQQAVAAVWLDIRDGQLEMGDVRFARLAAGRRNREDAHDGSRVLCPSPYFIGVVLITPLTADGGLPRATASESLAYTRFLLSQRPLLSMALTRLELAEAPSGLPGPHTMRLAYVIGPIPSAQACVRILNNVIGPMQNEAVKNLSRAHQLYCRQPEALPQVSCLRSIREEAGDDAVFIYSDAELRGEYDGAGATSAVTRVPEHADSARTRTSTRRLLVPSVN